MRCVMLGLALAAAVASASACATSVEVQPEATSSTAAATSSTTAPTNPNAATPTVAPGAAAGTGALDWDGVTYDYGQIVATQGDEIDFDRWQVYLDGGAPVDAKSMTSEPIVAGNSDMPGVNENPALRRYRVAPGAELLRLANVDALCDFDAATPPAPVWTPFTMAALEARTVEGIDQPQTALTFDAGGRVVRIRVSSSC